MGYEDKTEHFERKTWSSFYFLKDQFWNFPVKEFLKNPVV